MHWQGIPAPGRSLFSEQVDVLIGDAACPGVTAERRRAQRHAMVLAAEWVELAPSAKLSARPSDIGRTGCYIDTLNPTPQRAEVGAGITHGSETFVTQGRVVYVSCGSGMGIGFANLEEGELVQLDRWRSETGREF